MYILEPYILFLFGILLIAGIVITYFASIKYEFLIISVVLSALVAGFFFENVINWTSEEIEYGLRSYLKAGLIFFSGFMGLIYYLKKFRTHKFKISLNISLFLLFIIFSVASTFYSIDTKNTLNRSVLLFFVSLFLVGLNTWLDSEEKLKRLINTLYYLAIIFIVINLIMLLANPARVWWWRSPNRFIGITAHPNELGGFCMVNFPIFYWKIYNSSRKQKIVATIFSLLNLVILLLTGSRTSLLVSVIGLFIWLIIYKDWIKILLFFIIILLGGIFITQFNISTYKRDAGSNITDLTERDLIWKGAALFIYKKPIIGYGYSVEGKIFDNQKLLNMEEQYFNPNSQQPLHNGYISIFIGGGIIGFLLWYIPFFMVIYKTTRTPDNLIFKPFVLSVMLPILIANIVESAIVGYFSATDIYFLLAWIIGDRFYRQKT